MTPIANTPAYPYPSTGRLATNAHTNQFLAVASKRVWPVVILGVPFDPLTISDAVDRIETMIDQRQPHYVVTPNVDFLVQSQHDTELHQILVHADLVLCDGKPLVWASHWLGNTLPGRVAGADVVPVLLRRAAERGWKIFLLGGGPGVGAEAARRIAEKHPTLPPVAHFSPPCRPLEQMNHEEIITHIRAAKPDIVLVCFGCPKQEKWIFHHYRTLGVPMMIGAGGTVDFLAGRLKRAPIWMQKCGIEWFFRLQQEPRRLFKRYFGDVLNFFPALLVQRWYLSPSTPKTIPERAPSSTKTCYGLKVQARERFQCDVLQSAPFFWANAVKQSGHCLFDMSSVRSIDSTGIAFLAHWQRSLAQHQRNLILFHPSPEVRAALGRMHLTEEFVIVDDTSPNSPRVSPASRLAAALPQNVHPL